MKTHEFKTEKGEFIAVELPKVHFIFGFNDEYSDLKSGKRIGCSSKLKIICKLSEVTEYQAKGVVDEPLFGIYKAYSSDFKNKIMAGEYSICYPIESLHSLLISKGVDLNNGNWYLFKKI